MERTKEDVARDLRKALRKLDLIGKTMTPALKKKVDKAIAEVLVKPIVIDEHIKVRCTTGKDEREVNVRITGKTAVGRALVKQLTDLL